MLENESRDFGVLTMPNRMLVSFRYHFFLLTAFVGIVVVQCN